MGAQQTATCLAFAGLWLASGCAFPVLSSNEPRDARAYSYTPRSRDAHDGRATTAHEPRRSYQTPTRALGPTSRRRTASVLSPVPGDLGEPPAPASCFEELTRLQIAFESVAQDAAHGVRLPVRLMGPVAGVTFAPANDSETHAILDCRLALALHAWADALRQSGVVRVEHYSIYRPGARVGGGNRVSGHAHGLAIDAARFVLSDGTRLDVLEDWEGRERGASPCPMRPDEGFGSRLLRSVTCHAIDDALFQVVITPHHDRAHQNHVHLELKPEVDWTYVR